MAESFHNELTFFVNGEKVVETNVEPEMSLLTYLRTKRNLTGTKLGCGEGGCGACTVMVSSYEDPTDVVISSAAAASTPKTVVHKAINACLAPLCSVEGCHVVTVEGIGSIAKGLHPVQQRVADFHGSQCGFCTPGIVMALYTFFRNNPNATQHEVEESMDGNLCRCTGYRPILDGAKSLASDNGCCGGSNGGGCERLAVTNAGASESKDKKEYGLTTVQSSSHAKIKNYPRYVDLNDPLSIYKTDQKVSSGGSSSNSNENESKTAAMKPLLELSFPEFLTSHPTVPLKLTSSACTWYRPTTLESLAALKHQFPKAKIVVGNTEVGVETKFKFCAYPVRIATTHIPRLKQLSFDANTDALTIGASVTLTAIKTQLSHMMDGINSSSASSSAMGLKPHHLPTLNAIVTQLRWFSSTQIRNAACIAGNIATASPISDMNPVLQACNATLVLQSHAATGSTQQRTVKMTEFFLDYRKVDMTPTEVIVEVIVPLTGEDEYSASFKQARRREDDIAIVTSGMRVKFQQPPSSSSSPAVSAVPLIDNITMSFGGMWKTTICATKTQAKLRGLPWTLETVRLACAEMGQELLLPLNTPGGQEAFRNTLANSFVFKFYLEACRHFGIQPDSSASAFAGDKDGDSDDVEVEWKSAIERYERPVSSGFQEYQTPASAPSSSASPSSSPSPSPEVAKLKKNQHVGKNKKHMSANAQVTGEALYCDDIPDPQHTAHGALVSSRKPHANIMSVDTSEAEKAPGFIAYVSAKDVMGTNMIGDIFRDEELFATDVVHTVGQPIGVVLATTQQLACEAANKVKVEYEDILPAILSIEDAIEHKSFYDQHHWLQTGDNGAGVDSKLDENNFHVDDKTNVQKALADSPHVLTGRCKVGGQEHFYLETQACLAVPHEQDEMVVHSSTQNCTVTQEFVAEVLGVMSHRVIVKVKRLGGGFGGKETRSVNLACLAAVAAKHADRPVRLTLDRNVDFQFSGGRHPFIGDYRVGFTSEGKLTALDIELYNNAGWSFDLSGPVMDRALFHVDNVYHFPVVRARGNVCKTNLPSNTAFRGFGGPQGMMMTEMIMDRIATQLKMDPMHVRQINFYKEAQPTHFGQSLVDNNISACWEAVKAKSLYAQRSKEVEEFNRTHTYRKRGVAMVPTKFGVSFTAHFLNQGAALVLVYKDGSVLLSHGGTEMGQGLHTKMCQVAAQALGIPVDMVYVNETATDKVANTSATAASFSSDINGMAVFNACQEINKRLSAVRTSVIRKRAGTGGDDANAVDKGSSSNTNDVEFDTITVPHGHAVTAEEWSEITHSAYFQRINLCAQGFHKVPNVGYDFDHHEGTPFRYFTYGAAAATVDVDMLTGDFHVLNADVVMDLGCSLNPAIDVGQIEGAFAQGMGWCTMEELIFGDQHHKWARPGHMVTQGPGFYKLPGFNDVPVNLGVYLLKDVPNPNAIHSSKAVGEPPFFMASCVFFAIKQALNSYRSQSSSRHLMGIPGSTSAADADADAAAAAAAAAAADGVGNGDEGKLPLNGFFQLNAPLTSERIRLAAVDGLSQPFLSNMTQKRKEQGKMVDLDNKDADAGNEQMRGVMHFQANGSY